MDPAVNDISIWAAITHQRFLLRRAATTNPCDIALVEAALGEIHTLAHRADAGALAPVASLVRKRVAALAQRRALDRTTLFTLLDTLDSAYHQAMARV